MSKVKLGDVMTLHRGYDLPNARRIDGDVPIIGSSGVSGFHNVARLHGKNVITGRCGTIGKVFYHDGPCWPLNTALYVEDFHGNNERYIAYLLEAILASPMINGGDKSTVPGVDRNALHAMEIPYIENHDEQDLIANALSSIDDKIALSKKMMAELEDTARLIYDYWFTQFDFPDENGKPYRSSGGKMVYNETLKREIPEGWEAGLMSDLGSVVSGATPSTGDSSNYADEGIAWITPNDLSDNDSFMHISHGKRDVSGVGLASCSAVMMPAGSTIMSSRAPIGYLAVAETACCTNQGCKSLVADAGYPSYFNFFTVQRLMPLIRSQGAGTTFAEVSKEDFASVRLARPPKGMAERFEKSVLPLCEKSKRLQTETVELSSLRDWLLPMLMNGQVSISG